MAVRLLGILPLQALAKWQRKAKPPRKHRCLCMVSRVSWLYSTRVAAAAGSGSHLYHDRRCKEPARQSQPGTWQRRPPQMSVALLPGVPEVSNTTDSLTVFGHRVSDALQLQAVLTPRHTWGATDSLCPGCIRGGCCSEAFSPT